MESSLFSEICKYGFGFETIPETVYEDVFEILKMKIGDEKIRLYDSFKDKRTVCNIQSILKKNIRLTKIVEEYTERNEFKESLFQMDYDQVYFKIIDKFIKPISSIIRIRIKYTIINFKIQIWNFFIIHSKSISKIKPPSVCAKGCAEIKFPNE